MSGTEVRKRKLGRQMARSPKTTQCAGEFGTSVAASTSVSIDHKAATAASPGREDRARFAFALHVKYKVVRNVR